jgi:hypothetical protein
MGISPSPLITKSNGAMERSFSGWAAASAPPANITISGSFSFNRVHTFPIRSLFQRYVENPVKSGDSLLIFSAHPGVPLFQEQNRAEPSKALQQEGIPVENF